MPWALYGMLLAPVALPHVLLARNRTEEEVAWSPIRFGLPSGHRTCPYCDATVHEDAIACRRCRQPFYGKVPSGGDSAPRAEGGPDPEAENGAFAALDRAISRRNAPKRLRTPSDMAAGETSQPDPAPRPSADDKAPRPPETRPQQPERPTRPAENRPSASPEPAPEKPSDERPARKPAPQHSTNRRSNWVPTDWNGGPRPAQTERRAKAAPPASPPGADDDWDIPPAPAARQSSHDASSRQTDNVPNEGQAEPADPLAPQPEETHRQERRPEPVADSGKREMPLIHIGSLMRDRRKGAATEDRTTPPPQDHEPHRSSTHGRSDQTSQPAPDRQGPPVVLSTAGHESLHAMENGRRVLDGDRMQAGRNVHRRPPHRGPQENASRRGTGRRVAAFVTAAAVGAIAFLGAGALALWSNSDLIPDLASLTGLGPERDGPVAVAPPAVSGPGSPEGTEAGKPEWSVSSSAESSGAEEGGGTISVAEAPMPPEGAPDSETARETNSGGDAPSAARQSAPADAGPDSAAQSRASANGPPTALVQRPESRAGASRTEDTQTASVAPPTSNGSGSDRNGAARGSTVQPPSEEDVIARIIAQLNERRQNREGASPQPEDKLRAEDSDRISATGELVATVQRELEARGLEPGPVDGKVGPMTREAVRAFQRRMGLEPTGEIDRTTLIQLGVL